MSKRYIFATSIVAIVFIAAIGAKTYATREAKSQVDQAIEELPENLQIDYDDLSYGLLGKSITMTDIKISDSESGNKFNVGTLKVSGIDRDKQIPRSLKLNADDIEFEFKENSYVSELWSGLEYQSAPKADLSLSYLYNEQEKTFNLKKLGFSSKEVADLNFSFSLSNMDLNKASNPADIIGAKLVNASIVFEDLSVIDRLFTYFSANMKKDKNELRNMVLSQIDQLASQSSEEFTKKSLLELKNFVEKSGKLKIEASPEVPASFLEIQTMGNPLDIIAALNLQIEAR